MPNTKSMGPLHKTIFPYEYHFSTINTHTFTPTPLTGDLTEDRKMVFEALAAGHCFIGYDLPASTLRVQFLAQGRDINGIMGDEIPAPGAVTLQAKLPSRAEIRLIQDGKCIKSLLGDTITHIPEEPGAYRIEAYKHFLGKRRGWIFSNPIYIR